MDSLETSLDDQINGEDSTVNVYELSDDLRALEIRNESLLAEVEALRESNQILHSKLTEKEESLIVLQQQKDEALKHNIDISKDIELVSSQRDSLRDELHELEVSSREREGELLREKEGIRSELEVSTERINELLEEKNENIRVFSENFEVVKSVRECLVGVIEKLDEEKVGKDSKENEELRDELELNDEFGAFLVELKGISKLVSAVELKLSEYQETWKKEKRELDNSVVSLTEENRDINSLLRIALVEKEAVEKSLNKLKGNNEQKKVAILQIAERGLQRVGFGFMMGAGANEPSSDNSVDDMGGKPDGSECEEEVVSLASTVERIMKNLRLEITQLRRSLEETRYYQLH
ncbi:unnamed protein product [Ilex paraguariensis]|uniref:Uncharacterized protein n=1 Tax=Ilex paraguariensis TaxID=185542 RepID=A0ABC8SUQ3_9AQUA